MTDLVTNAAKKIDHTPPTIPDQSAVPKPESLSSSIPSLLDMLPDSLKCHVVQYLQFEDLIHNGKLNVDDRQIPKDIIFQYIHGTDFYEPIRYIFQDFESMDIDDDERLEKLEALMKNVLFLSYLSFWQSITDYTLSYEDCTTPYSESFVDEFVDWIKATENSPSKNYVLSKLGHHDELKRILTRGRQFQDIDATTGLLGKYEYAPALPPVFVDVFGRIIAKGDLKSVSLFEQLASHPTLERYFTHDLRKGAFEDKLLQATRTGQPHVVLKDEFSDTYGSSGDYMFESKRIVHSAVMHDRFDILDGILKKFLKVSTRDFYLLFYTIFCIIQNEGSVPGYELAKDLIKSNIDTLRDGPEFEEFCGNTLPMWMLWDVVLRTPNPELESFLRSLMEQFKDGGIQIRAEQALELASDSGNDYYNDYFIKNLPP